MHRRLVQALLFALVLAILGCSTLAPALKASGDPSPGTTLLGGAEGQTPGGALFAWIPCFGGLVLGLLLLGTPRGKSRWKLLVPAMLVQVGLQVAGLWLTGQFEKPSLLDWTWESLVHVPLNVLGAITYVTLVSLSSKTLRSHSVRPKPRSPSPGPAVPNNGARRTQGIGTP